MADITALSQIFSKHRKEEENVCMQYKRNCSRSRKKFLLDMDEDIDLAKSVDRECCEFKLKQVSSKRARTIAKFLSSTSVHFRTRNSLHADLSALLPCDAILKLRDASI